MISAFLFAGCSRPIANLNSTGENVICFGASITHGYGVAQGKDFPALLSESLNEPVINAGNPGDTTRHALDRLDRDVLNMNPKLVLIEFGANDYFQKMSAIETFRNLEKLIRKIQGAHAAVVLVEVRLGLLSDKFGKRMKELAEKTKAGYVSHVMKGIIANPQLKVDSIHPNAKGYEIIAKRIHKVVAPLLRKMKKY